MKKEQREEARRLRLEEGLSVKEICTRLGVAKSSVSVWVRDIELTSEQRTALKKRNPVYAGQHLGAQANITKHREIRRQYQEEGRQKARENDPLHIAGCMLYWGEGKKNKNSLILTNSDPSMMVFYIKFLRQSLSVSNENISVYLNCYLGNDLSVVEIENYWLDLLDLPRSCLGKTIVNAQPRSSQQKGRKLNYGVCSLAVHNTRIVHHVYGAIQEYSGIDKPEWLM